MTALRIDPNAGQPQLMGSRWVRRKPDGDDPWDGPVEVAGVFDNGPDHGGLELVVRTVAFYGDRAERRRALADPALSAAKREG